MSSVAQRLDAGYHCNDQLKIYLDSVFSQGKFEAIECSERKGCCSLKRQWKSLTCFFDLFDTFIGSVFPY